MLEFCVTKLSEFTRTENVWDRNMALETCLLHARNLREFFYCDDKQYETDARAYEFVKERNKWKETRPEETEWVKKVRERANTELAHLTYKKYTESPPEKGWRYDEIRRDFLKVVKIFLDHLPGKYMGKNLREIEHICLDVDASTDRQDGLSTSVGTTTTVSIATRVEDNSDYSRYPDKRCSEGVFKK